MKTKSIGKQQLLEQLMDTVDGHLREATRDFQNLSEQALLRQPRPGSWSAAQCFEHLNQYGKYYLQAIEEALLRGGTKPDDPFESTWLGSYFTKMMDPESGKKKIKTFKAYVPAENLDAHRVVAEFIQQQETLLNYLKRAGDRNLNARVPISLTRWIRLKLGDVFQFVVAHDARHLAQARRAARP